LGSSWLIVHGSWPEKSGKRKDQSTGAFVVHGSWFMVHSSWFMAGDELKAERGKIKAEERSWFIPNCKTSNLQISMNYEP